MTIKFSTSFSKVLKDGVICIYTSSQPKHPSSPDSNKYTFKTSSPRAIDYALIKKDLNRENPLAIIHRSDGYHRAVVHDSIMQKLYAINENDDNKIIWYTQLDEFFEWRKTTKGNISEIIKMIKEIKNASWPNKQETIFKVDIIKI